MEEQKHPHQIHHHHHHHHHHHQQQQQQQDDVVDAAAEKEHAVDDDTDEYGMHMHDILYQHDNHNSARQTHLLQLLADHPTNTCTNSSSSRAVAIACDGGVIIPPQIVDDIIFSTFLHSPSEASRAAETQRVHQQQHERHSSSSSCTSSATKARHQSMHNDVDVDADADTVADDETANDDRGYAADAIEIKMIASAADDDHHHPLALDGHQASIGSAGVPPSAAAASSSIAYPQITPVEKSLLNLHQHHSHGRSPSLAAAMSSSVDIDAAEETTAEGDGRVHSHDCALSASLLSVFHAEIAKRDATIAALQKNISLLYRTARNEIIKKNHRILQLMQNKMKTSKAETKTQTAITAQQDKQTIHDKMQNHQQQHTNTNIEAQPSKHHTKRIQEHGHQKVSHASHQKHETIQQPAAFQIHLSSDHHRQAANDRKRKRNHHQQHHQQQQQQKNLHPSATTPFVHAIHNASLMHISSSRQALMDISASENNRRMRATEEQANAGQKT